MRWIFQVDLVHLLDTREQELRAIAAEVLYVYHILIIDDWTDCWHGF